MNNCQTDLDYKSQTKDQQEILISKVIQSNFQSDPLGYYFTHRIIGSVTIYLAVKLLLRHEQIVLHGPCASSGQGKEKSHLRLDTSALVSLESSLELQSQQYYY